MSFAAVWSGSTIFSIPKDLVRIYTVSHFQRLIRDYTISILSLIRVYTICHSQQSDQDLHYLPLFRHYHHRHIHFRALFSSTEGWAFWQVFLEGVLSTQNDFKGQQNPYLASLSFSSTSSHAWFPWPARSFLCNHIQLAYFCSPACAALYMSKPSHPTGAEHHI